MRKNQKNMALSAGLLAFGILLFLFSGSDSSDLSAAEIKRNDPGGGRESLNLEATVSDIRIDGLEINIEEREYTAEECKELFLECRDELLKMVLAENEDLNTVTKDLNFSEKLSGYPFLFDYGTNHPECINSDGLLITEKPFTAIVKVTGTYGDFSDSFLAKISAKPDDEIKKRVLKEKLLLKIEESGQEDTEVILPSELEGESVNYKKAGEKREPAYLLLGLVSAVAVILGAGRDEKAKREAYKKAILKEYPTVLKKISLYLSSGMNLRNIWQAVYEEGIKKKGADNPFYKEMGISINEISSGISEGLAYTRFGERTGEADLIRFTVLLSQNLRKGSSKLKGLLEEEVTKAFMEKKQRAVKEGEEAGTKMLLPMMLLLIDVMIIIIIPAFRGI